MSKARHACTDAKIIKMKIDIAVMRCSAKFFAALRCSDPPPPPPCPPHNGHVYVNQRLDRETQESYLLTIRATNIGRNCVKIGAKSFLVHKRFWGQNEVILLSLVCAFECKNAFIEQNIEMMNVMPPAFSRETQSNQKIKKS